MARIFSDGLAQQAYFFDEGLSFECRKCGDCCTGAPGTIYVSRDEIDAIAGHLKIPVKQFCSRYLYPYRDSYSICEDRQGRCLFYNDGCLIYALRPSQCRTFPFWFSNLRSQKRWQQVAVHCPGIGRGRHFSKDEILQIVQTTMQI